MSSKTSAPRSYPFVIANAFTQDVFGGNPAAIVFLDPSDSDTLTQEERQKFAKGFSQPIIVFLTPTSTSTGAVVSFDVQYFTPTDEVRLCGHGTVAAIKVILDSATNSPGFGQGTRFPSFAASETHTAEFTTVGGTVISARKVVIPDEVGGEGEDWFEVVLPAGKLQKLPAEEEERVLGIINRAVGKELQVKYIGIGEPPFHQDLLIVLDESENIEQLKIDTQALKATGVFEKHIITTDSTSGKFSEDYITRMFAPNAGIDEDHVCGSANSTMGPYWATQKGITELKVRQVSERGGRLRVGIDGDKIKVRGQVKVISVGQLFL